MFMEDRDRFPAVSARHFNDSVEGAKKCLICSSHLAPAKRYPGLLQCPDCNFLTADLALTDEQLRQLYGADYFHGDEYANYLADEEELRLNFRRRLDTLLPLLQGGPRGYLHEVGCAYGFFLSEAARHFTRVSGIDIAEDATAYARDSLGLEVTTGDYLCQQFYSPVDVICMWDTLEHLRDSHLYIRKAASDLRRGGLFAFTTGDVESLNARLRGPRWRMVHPPTHLHYFGERSIARLLYDSGFNLVLVQHPGNVRTLRAILYGVVAMRARRKGLCVRLERVIPGLSWPVYLNLWDIMFVIARRR